MLTDTSIVFDGRMIDWCDEFDLERDESLIEQLVCFAYFWWFEWKIGGHVDVESEYVIRIRRIVL